MRRQETINELLRLSSCCPCFSTSQAQAACELVSKRSDGCRQALTDLQASGWLWRRTMLARPLLDLSSGPLLSWHPGDTEPNYHALAWKLAKRWNAGPVSQTVFGATKKTLAHFGQPGLGRPSRAVSVTHDLHVTEMYLQLLRARRRDASLWVGERDLACFGWTKVPDAVLANGSKAVRVLDFAGSYPVCKLREFGDYFGAFGINLPFEMW